MTAAAPIAPPRDELAEAADLRNRQTLAARERRLQKKAVRDPAVEELLGDHNAAVGALEQLRRQHSALIVARDELGVEASRLQVENIALRQKLDAADAARLELLKNAEASDAALVALRAELADAKDKLVSALTKKPAR